MDHHSEDKSTVKPLGNGKFEISFSVETAGEYALEILQFLDQEKAVNITGFPKDINILDTGISAIKNCKVNQKYFFWRTWN